MLCTICAGCLPVYQSTTDISFYRKERVSFNPDYFYSTNHCVDSGRIDKIVKTSKLDMLVSDRLIRSQTHQLGLFSRNYVKQYVTYLQNDGRRMVFVNFKKNINVLNYWGNARYLTLSQLSFECKSADFWTFEVDIDNKFLKQIRAKGVYSQDSPIINVFYDESFVYKITSWRLHNAIIIKDVRPNKNIQNVSVPQFASFCGISFSVIGIANYSFIGLRNCVIDLPPSLSYIEEHAFYKCDSLSYTSLKTELDNHNIVIRKF